MSKFKLAMVQMAVGMSKPDNVARAVKFITEASSAGANIVTLPECFNSPYGTKFFPEYAEPIPGPSTQALSEAAKNNAVYVVGGSIPEKDGDKIYNTCAIYNPSGEMIAKHRKLLLVFFALISFEQALSSGWIELRYSFKKTFVRRPEQIRHKSEF
ncbi:omega-amidase NIT2-like [Elysia marginata]|uniref:omega-amidase n=1 Tax=Elysia marginata TaxID=1093978 RepID=A0AAV4GNB6_9GAST|nr:omega-amidase NIT2-like [Elysia marginata]